MHKPHPPTRRPPPPSADRKGSGHEGEAIDLHLTRLLADGNTVEKHRERIRRQARQTCALLDRLQIN